MRRDLTGKGRALLMAGTLCVGLGAAGTALSPAALPGVLGAHADLIHFARGLLLGLGVTLEVGAWLAGRTA